MSIPGAFGPGLYSWAEHWGIDNDSLPSVQLVAPQILAQRVLTRIMHHTARFFTSIERAHVCVPVRIDGVHGVFYQEVDGAAMALTRAERRLQKEAEEIATIAKTDIWDIESYDPDARKAILQLAINTTVIGDVVSKYTLIDELLTVLICNFFFRRSKKDQTFRKLWKTKKFQTFVHYISDEIYLLQKMRIVHAIAPLPSQVRSRIEAVNAVRNALAHSYFPENRRQYMAHKKVLYSGEDIRSKEGLAAFQTDFDLIWRELAKRAFGLTPDEASVTV